MRTCGRCCGIQSETMTPQPSRRRSTPSTRITNGVFLCSLKTVWNSDSSSLKEKVYLLIYHIFRSKAHPKAFNLLKNRQYALKSSAPDWWINVVWGQIDWLDCFFDIFFSTAPSSGYITQPTPFRAENTVQVAATQCKLRLFVSKPVYYISTNTFYYFFGR